MGEENPAPTAVQSVVSRYTNCADLEHCNDSDDSVKLVGCLVIYSSKYLSNVIFMTIRLEFCAESARSSFIC
jgi:hypothetical protein